MESIGIRELRQHASRYVSLARDGERVAVTDRGKLVAYLVPAEQPSSILTRLESAGEYRPPVENLLDLGPSPRPVDRERPLSDILTEMRDEEDR